MPKNYSNLLFLSLKKNNIMGCTVYNVQCNYPYPLLELYFFRGKIIKDRSLEGLFTIYKKQMIFKGTEFLTQTQIF